jgi:2-iminobutanoate/2-iminopropanoate deaminase
MNYINSKNAPLPLGHYSQAIEANGFIFVSGQLPIDPKEPEKLINTIEEQTLLTLKNIEAILLAANCNKNSITKTTVYLTDLSLFPKVNAIYQEFFKNHKPARAIAPITKLPKNYLLEIDAIAVKTEKTNE